MSSVGTVFIYVLNRKWLFLGLIPAVLLSMMTPPASLSTEGWRALGLALSALIWFIKRPIANPELGILIIVLHVALKIASNEEVARSFFNDSVFFIMGVLMLGTAIINQRIDRSLGKLLIKSSGGSMKKFVFSLVVLAAFITSLTGEYVAAAMLMPFILKIMSDEKNRILRRTTARPTLFALAFGCIIGGALAPSGGARNVVMIQFLKEQHQYTMDYFTWVKMALPLFVIAGAGLTLFIISSFPARRLRNLNLDSEIFDENWRKPLTPEDKMSLIIMGVVLVLWFFFSHRLGMGIVACFGAALFLIMGLVKWEDFNSGVNWGVIILYSAVVMLGTQLYDKGGADWVANYIVEKTGVSFIHENLYLIILIFIPLIANIMGAIGAVAVTGPFILKLACASGLNCVHVAMLTAIASSYAFFNFKVSPASAIAYTTGYLKPAGFFRLGWKMTAFSVIVLLLVSKFYWNLI